MEEIWLALIVIAVGAFSLLCAIKDWDWFILSAKAKLVVLLLGRKGARIFYAVLGIVLIAMGVIVLLPGSTG
ncbi:MAG: immunity 17 family protein [Planctomycetes bacterium]|nr:immunity 17 family protein [Planctomycetota bacterium]